LPCLHTSSPRCMQRGADAFPEWHPHSSPPGPAEGALAATTAGDHELRQGQACLLADPSLSACMLQHFCHLDPSRSNTSQAGWPRPAVVDALVTVLTREVFQNSTADGKAVRTCRLTADGRCEIAASKSHRHHGRRPTVPILARRPPMLGLHVRPAATGASCIKCYTAGRSCPCCIAPVSHCGCGSWEGVLSSM